MRRWIITELCFEPGDKPKTPFFWDEAILRKRLRSTASRYHYVVQINAKFKLTLKKDQQQSNK